MSVSLYRRYRPQLFGDVAGQDIAVDVLRKALQRKTVGHAYLFSGPRGCGKTSVARLLAKGLNCSDPGEGYEPCCRCEHCLAITAGESLDVVEIDGASNNGVEEIRELKNHVALSSFSSQWKVYIIDEVHMLSIAAFNALLKTLEEPPHFVVFILATTEPQKVPVTIRSRCQHIPFRRIEVEPIVRKLKEVAGKEGAPWEEEAILEIARQSDGAMRDALSLMEQSLSLGNGELSTEAVLRLLGGGTLSDLKDWVWSLKSGSSRPLCLMEEMFRKGASPHRVLEGLFLLFRNLFAAKRWGDVALDGLSLSGVEKHFLLEEQKRWDESELFFMMQSLTKLIPQARLGLRSDVLSGLLAALDMKLQVLEPTPAVRGVHSSSRAGEGMAQGDGEEKNENENEDEKDEALSSVEEEKPFPSHEPPLPAEGQDDSWVESSRDEWWSSFHETLFEKDLFLYALLLGTEVRSRGKEVHIRFPETIRYRFEVLSTGRNSGALSSCIEEQLGEGVQLFLHCGSADRECGQLLSEEPRETSPEKGMAPLPLCGDEEPPQPRGRRDNRETEKGGIPFEGLVQEILNWGGEILMIKRGEGEEFDPYEADDLQE